MQKMKQRIELTESAIRKIIRDILLEEANQVSWSSDPSKTYYWNDVPEVNELIARLSHESTPPTLDPYSHGATKYRYAYTPWTGEISLMLPVEKVVNQGTRAYNAIKAQFDKNPDHIRLSNDPAWFEDKPVLRPSLANRMSRKAILLIYGIFDSLETFLDKGINGDFGEKIQNDLKVAYPKGEAKVGSFDEEAIGSMKSGGDLVYQNVVKYPIIPNKPERFVNLVNLIKELSSKVAESTTLKQSISPEQIAQSVSLKPDEKVTAAASLAAAQINAALELLHDLYSPQTTDFARPGFGGQVPGDLEREASRLVFDRVATVLRAV